MVTKKPLSWFLTPTGRNFSFGVIATTGIAGSLAKFGPNTYFINKYKDLVHRYENGHPVPLNDELSRKFDKCLDILQIPETKRKFIEPFNIFGLDLFHAGSLTSRFGCIIGVPINFTYKTVNDIDKDNLQVNLNKIDWDSATGKQLAESLIYEENIQLFALCREILATANNKVYFDSAYPLLTTFIIFTLGQKINGRLKLYSAPKIVRITLYSILAFFGAGFYCFLKDYTEVAYETDVDKQLRDLGPEFVASGIQFYNNLLNRNQALYELMGNEGKRKYTKLGNENFIFRQPRIALTHRKQFFQAACKEKTDDTPSNVKTTNN